MSLEQYIHFRKHLSNQYPDCERSLSSSEKPSIEISRSFLGEENGPQDPSIQAGMESQKHRISWFGNDLKAHPVPTLLQWVGLPPAKAAQGPSQTVLECLQRWGIHSFSAPILSCQRRWGFHFSLSGSILSALSFVSNSLHPGLIRLWKSSFTSAQSQFGPYGAESGLKLPMSGKGGSARGNRQLPAVTACYVMRQTPMTPCVTNTPHECPIPPGAQTPMMGALGMYSMESWGLSSPSVQSKTKQNKKSKIFNTGSTKMLFIFIYLCLLPNEIHTINILLFSNQ